MKQEPYTVNGKVKGCFYELDDGRKAYIAHKTPGKIYRPKMAWTIEEHILRKCQQSGIKYVGVVVREGNRKLFYLTLVEDLYEPGKGFLHYGKTTVDRGLPAKFFRVNPATRPDVIASRASIGR